jgi:signal transduction histidine kinase
VEGATAVSVPAEPEARPAPEGLPPAALDRLAWLAPSAASLAELARPPASGLWGRLRVDPGLVLLASRQPLPPDAPPALSARLAEPAVLDDALRLLGRPAFVDWSASAVAPVYRAALDAARHADALARRTGRCDPDRAWACALLAPLGWLAVAAVAPGRLAECLEDPGLATHPGPTQQEHWGVEQDALARRLARRWGLPDWLAAVVGRLGLSAPPPGLPGRDPDLFHVTRLATALARQTAPDLGLVPPDAARDSAAALGLSLQPAARGPQPGAQDEAAEAPAPGPGARGPASEPLLPDLLAAAADNRRLRVVPARLELEADGLHHALQEQARSEARRLQQARLASLAELAAGAGHEINNPLAVISGQAEYLLAHLERGPLDADVARKALQTVVAQTRRIHGLLRDLMQFARPAAPAPAWFDLPALLGDVAASLRDLASQRRVRLEVSCVPDRLAVHADAAQVRTALACLARNAVEAAPPDGWARLSLAAPDGGPAVVAVEDSGPGPAPEQRPHLFDPFFSGRSAGRGRGLGLPLAWRLADLQGGEVALEAAPSLGDAGPTRFILRLPHVTPAGRRAA